MASPRSAAWRYAEHEVGVEEVNRENGAGASTSVITPLDRGSFLLCWGGASDGCPLFSNFVTDSAGLISAFIFCFTLCWNEFIYALTFLQSTSNKTVPVAIVNEFVDGDIYRWGSLMAGALAGSLPLVILYAFFVEHYVSAMTGAVKE